MADKDRERSRDRPSAGGHAHTSSGSGGALSFLPNLFGRRPATVATSRQTSDAIRQTSDAIRSGERRESIEPPVSPHNRLKPLPMAEGKRAPSPAPEARFHLQSSIELMDQKEGISEAELCEIIKATAVWLAGLMIEHETATDEISAREIRHLYRQAIRHANPRGSKQIRTATKRLLAALITIAPPGGDSGFIAVDLPDPINAVSLYKIITSAASSNAQSINPSIEEIYVEVGALKALTKNGVEVDGTEGIVGWLARTLHETEDEWVKWCGKRDEDIEWEELSKRKVSPS